MKTLGKSAAGTPFQQLVAAIHQDVGSQLKRTGSVESLAKNFLGKPAPKFQLVGLNGKPVDPKSFAGKIIVLHFWSYRAKPLVEPYGQVGYLDFLNGKRRKLGVKVFGVAVDPRLAKSSSRPAAVRSVRKLKSFMNLSYDVTLDSGTLLRKFGDPQKTGAKLPLWVVIDPQGKVALYHVGFYQIKPNEGLRALDGKLIQLIREQRSRNKSNP